MINSSSVEALKDVKVEGELALLLRKELLRVAARRAKASSSRLRESVPPAILTVSPRYLPVFSQPAVGYPLFSRPWATQPAVPRSCPCPSRSVPGPVGGRLKPPGIPDGRCRYAGENQADEQQWHPGGPSRTHRQREARGDAAAGGSQEGPGRRGCPSGCRSHEVDEV